MIIKNGGAPYALGNRDDAPPIVEHKNLCLCDKRKNFNKVV